MQKHIIGLKAYALGVLLVLLSQGVAAAIQTPHTWETDNGLPVYFVPAPHLPMLDMRLTFHAGSARDTTHPGVARLTNRLLASGAGGLDSDAIAQRFEQVGAQFSATAMRDMAVVYVRTLTEPDWLEQALDTYIRVVSQPSFKARDVERMRRETLSALQREAQNPGDIASKVFYATLYGDHPYASHPLGTEESLARIRRADLIAFHQQHYVARNGVLVLVGGIELQQAKAIAERIAKALPEGVKAPPLPAVKPLAQAQTVRIHFPSEQVHVRVGQPLIARGDPDHFPLYVANHILGGGSFISRLFEQVRNQRGLAYSVHSYYVETAAAGPLIIAMQTHHRQAEEAVALLHEILSDLVTHGPKAQEVALSKDNIIGSFPLSIASNSDLLGQYAQIGFYGLPVDYLQQIIPNIQGVTPAAVQDALQRRVHPEHLLTVIVGGQAE
ncbi:M16 family metallopeptidase [Thiorhodospira sibirica]|uniref:M16 family metallopeptidase n=1 Tax=Thiorhodospira sibirica TaxID=154347 RepID=UPI00022C5DFF|nr:pitrilysin family protein [Thiorhodospira sibirica]